MINYKTFKRTYLDALDDCFNNHFQDADFNRVIALREQYPTYYVTFRFEDEHDCLGDKDEN